MRIAQVAPLFESVPPRLYGGSERIVSFLTEELVRQGHDVTLFASGDSRTSARLVACTPRALRLDPDCQLTLPHQILQLERVAEQAASFDIVHFHIDVLQLPLFRRVAVPHVTTMHGRLDLKDLQPLFRTYSEAPLVSISESQRVPLCFANWVGMVHHGLPVDLLRPVGEPKGYLAFVGRISPEKRPDHAIRIARAAGLKLKIAAKVDRVDREYFDEDILPMIDGRDVEFIGEIGEDAKAAFLSGAEALLFPIDWPEPFGLVMIEAMACGTPVIARRRGSVPEVMDDGVTGFVYEELDEAVAAVRRCRQLDRGLIRRTFERRFDAARMARDYLDVYLRVMSRSRGLLEIA